MTGVFKKYIRIMDVINRMIGWVLAIALGIMTVLIFWQVFARYVVGNSLTFSEEVSRFTMIWMTLLGAAYAIRKGTLISVDILPDFTKGNLSKAIKIMSYLLALIFYFVLIRFGWEMSQSVSFQRAPSTGVSMFWPMFALCAGGVLMFLNTIVVLIEELFREEE